MYILFTYINVLSYPPGTRVAYTKISLHISVGNFADGCALYDGRSTTGDATFGATDVTKGTRSVFELIAHNVGCMSTKMRD